MAIVYTFRASLGDMGTDSFNSTIQPVTVWILLVLCALITNVVMLNLLIAIISETFNDINEVAALAGY